MSALYSSQDFTLSPEVNLKEMLLESLVNHGALRRPLHQV